MSNIWIELDVYGYDSPEEQKAMELAGREDEKPKSWAPMNVNMGQVALMQQADNEPEETELTMGYGGIITVRMPMNVIQGIINRAGDLVLLQENTEDLPRVEIIKRDKDG